MVTFCFSVKMKSSFGAKMKFLIILSLFEFCFASEIVRLENGLISGTNYQLPNGKSVHAFYGVPYAAPPIHENRFKVNISKWKGCSLEFSVMKSNFFSHSRNHSPLSLGQEFGMRRPFCLHVSSMTSFHLPLLAMKTAFTWMCSHQK